MYTRISVMNVKIQTGECLYIQLDECLPKQTDIMDLRLRSCKGRDRQITERGGGGGEKKKEGKRESIYNASDGERERERERERVFTMQQMERERERERESIYNAIDEHTLFHMRPCLSLNEIERL